MDRVEILSGLPEHHRTAPPWFAERIGAEHPWPQPMETDGEYTPLASKAKGIYKPRWSEYALSVRQTLGGPYPDRGPLTREDGTWSYLGRSVRLSHTPFKPFSNMKLSLSGR